MILLLPTVSAVWYMDAEYIDIEVIISDGFSLIEEGGLPKVEYVRANLSLFPSSSYRQDVGDYDMSPRGVILEDSLLFEWSNPALGEYSYSVSSSVRIYNERRRITDKIDFPFSVEEELLVFIEPSPTIDSDNIGIVLLANQLAAGEDDLYVVVHKLALWTNENINYNLSTLTASVSQPASWVLRHKKGVCDELTNLFISLCRSLGIPARFVSGLAYTESDLFPERWGPHGWAEVYFPGVGWVDYDTTYGEFGFLDPTHIKFRDTVDVTTPSAMYKWLGRNVDLNSKVLDIIGCCVSRDNT